MNQDSAAKVLDAMPAVASALLRLLVLTHMLGGAIPHPKNAVNKTIRFALPWLPLA